ncbi:hypothetical protein C474_03280 [Halogeometricum pallidum JCM 14848]|uniref:Uncharacterized protein n=1 Tax=Halogeometricum pallidum JCM 14848 TaxID=1227487 RepID=M0DIE7_HALPD|nr:hypothetical protein [Halogeometricum pallidum]ELZ33949.1 hypothetical protein C474_03280 [Halogeometricum pallidum JCM 14848]
MNPNRRLCVIAAVALLVVTAGCVTVSPSIGSSEDSAVFERVSTVSEWGTSSVQASVTLAPAATTEMGVTRLNVITDSGSSFYTTTVDAGQTSVSLPIPTQTRSQIVAVNTVNGTVVDTYNVTVRGSRYP